jgi:hypothetical protein
VTAESDRAADTRLFDAALTAHAAGLCVVPPREDGSKGPLGSWKEFQARRPSRTEIERWYATGRSGIGLVCGAVSGGLEMLEFEGRAVAEGLADQYRVLAEAAGLGDVLRRVQGGYVERTPSGGFHLLYRVPRPNGNTKLAARLATEDELSTDSASSVKVLIETRGEGGYCIVAPTGGQVHPTGGAWELLAGGFDQIVTITDAERDELWTLARLLDETPEARTPETGSGPRDRPGDDYNTAPDVDDRVRRLLLEHGWSEVHRRNGTTYLRRPGKTTGVSATLGHVGPGVLRVFSTSTAFEPRAYSPFGVYATLDHVGSLP